MEKLRDDLKKKIDSTRAELGKAQVAMKKAIKGREAEPAAKEGVLRAQLEREKESLAGVEKKLKDMGPVGRLAKKAGTH